MLNDSSAKSRYDFMNASGVKDNVIDDYYPDPLSLDFNIFLRFATEFPIPKERDFRDFLRPDIAIPVYYKKNFDNDSDLWLDINEVPHRDYPEEDEYPRVMLFEQETWISMKNAYLKWKEKREKGNA